MTTIRSSLLLLLAVSSLLGQTATLRGVVSDESGAVVPGATVSVGVPGNSPKKTRSNGEGVYSFLALAAGDYEVQAIAPGLALPEPVKSR